MSAGSWQAFADALAEEDRCLGELGAAALAMTSALVFGPAALIEAADRSVDARRIMLAQAHLRRVSMMKSGFGDKTLRQVCGYAPASLRRGIFGSLRELRTRGIGLQITVANNKALITAGLARIANTIVVMRKAHSDQDGTYRRRGTVPLASGSMIVSRKA
jgi:hypothetical protein